MHRVVQNWQLYLDQIIQEWVGLTLPRPCVAMRGFSPTDGCMWCGSDIVPYTLCHCCDRSLKWSRVFRLGGYEPPLSDCILQGKYASWPEMLELIGCMLGTKVKGCVPPSTLVVPVPMPRFRKLFRRIDHAAVIAKEVAKVAGLRSRKCLIRKESTPQAAMTASGRRALKCNTMRVRHLARIRGYPVLLIDDVLTTGRTLEVACDTIRKAGASCVMVAVAGVTALPR